MGRVEGNGCCAWRRAAPGETGHEVVELGAFGLRVADRRWEVGSRTGAGGGALRLLAMWVPGTRRVSPARTSGSG